MKWEKIYKQVKRKVLKRKARGLFYFQQELFQYNAGRGTEGWIDDFLNYLKQPIKTKIINWKDVDKNESIQKELFEFLNVGIIEIDNIPMIPLEYEPEKLYLGLDSEDNGLGSPHYFQISVRDRVFISCSFRLLLRYITQRYKLTGANHTVFGTNIEYEFGNIVKDWDLDKEYCDVRWTKGGLKKFELIYLPDKLNWACKEDQRGVFKVWDTVTHWKIGVAAMGTILSEKMNFDFNKLDSDFYSLKYAAMDAVISRSYAAVQTKYYESKDITLKFTPGATALGFYLNGHSKSGDLLCKHSIYRSHTEEELTWLIEGFRGGRTEVFSLKEYDDEVLYADINSAYPYAMKYGKFPHLKTHFWAVGDKKIRKFIDSDYEGMVDCNVDTSGVDDFVKNIPYLGIVREVDKATRFLFPLGKWRGKYTFYEIRMAEALGYKFKFHKALIYEVTDLQPFADFVDICYSIRDEGTAKGDKMLRDIGKSLGNNLFGKFAQRINFTELDEPNDYNPNDIQNCIRLGNSVLVEKNEGFAPHSNVIWAAYITAMARHNLYEHMLDAAAKGNEIIYCDTDSIFLHGGKHPKTHQTRLGALKIEEVFSWFRAYLPKTYAYEHDNTKGYKAKGVPKDQRERFIRQGIVEYRKPLKLREALRRKNLGEKNKDKDIAAGTISSVNAWVTVSKQLKGAYTKRIVNKDKSTTPHIFPIKEKPKKVNPKKGKK